MTWCRPVYVARARAGQRTLILQRGIRIPLPNSTLTTKVKVSLGKGDFSRPLLAQGLKDGGYVYVRLEQEQQEQDAGGAGEKAAAGKAWAAQGGAPVQCVFRV